MLLKNRKNSVNLGKGFDKIKHILRKYKSFRKRLGNFAKRIIMPELADNDKKVEQFKRPFKRACSRRKFLSFNKDDIVLGRLLGAGGFGSVYTGTFRNNNVAVKIMHKITKNPAAQIESFKAELNTVGFEHPHIVKTLTATPLGSFEDGAWIVMEYAGHRTLQSLIDDPLVSMGPSRRTKFSLQIADALKYAHEHKVVHLDLKPANILITPDGKNCKLADFGCSQRVEIDTGTVSPTQRSTLTGTFAYRAPELLKGEAPSKKADIYALAVTMWQMVSRQTPFGNENQHVVIFGVVAYGQRPNQPDIELDPFEESYRELYSQCWLPSPLDRPTSDDLVDVLKYWKNHL